MKMESLGGRVGEIPSLIMRYECTWVINSESPYRECNKNALKITKMNVNCTI